MRMGPDDPIGENASQMSISDEVPFVPDTAAAGVLDGVRVVELADERAEYAGLLLAGMGAEVIKVEPPGGAPTRSIGPFVGDIAGPGRLVFFAPPHPGH